MSKFTKIAAPALIAALAFGVTVPAQAQHNQGRDYGYNHNNHSGYNNGYNNGRGIEREITQLERQVARSDNRDRKDRNTEILDCRALSSDERCAAETTQQLPGCDESATTGLLADRVAKHTNGLAMSLARDDDHHDGHKTDDKRNPRGEDSVVKLLAELPVDP